VTVAGLAWRRARLGLGRTFQISSLIPEFSALRNVMLAVQARQGSSFHFFKPVMRDASPDRARRAALERSGWGRSRQRAGGAELSHGERPAAGDRHRAGAGPRRSCSTSRWPAWGRKARSR
jgi:ABC-type uncharacterized transport system ATPase subunit